MGMVFIPEEALGADSLSVGITQERNWDTFPTPGHPTYKDVASYYRGQTGTRLFSHILDPQQPSQQRTKDKQLHVTQSLVKPGLERPSPGQDDTISWHTGHALVTTLHQFQLLKWDKVLENDKKPPTTLHFQPPLPLPLLIRLHSLHVL